MIDHSSNFLERIWRIACRWRTPPQWERREWQEELKGLARWAALEAEAVYDPVQHGDLNQYLSSRVLNALQTHHRREWRYGTRCCVHLSCPSTEYDSNPPHTKFEDPLSSSAMEAIEWHLTLHHSFQLLDEEDCELLVALYFEERTEADLAQDWGVSQSAISQRKQRALKRLRALLTDGGG